MGWWGGGGGDRVGGGGGRREYRSLIMYCVLSAARYRRAVSSGPNTSSNRLATDHH